MKEKFYSPSQYHLNLMKKTEPELAWRGGEFQDWQSRLRRRLRDLIGDFPDAKAPLDAEELEREETDRYVRMKIVFTSEECADVPAHLLVPTERDGPMPGMICLQGHSPGMHISLGQAQNEHEEELVAGDRDFALQAVHNGFVALAMEQRCFGERAETLLEHRWEHTCLDAVFHSLLLGKTVLGERCWDVMRAVDLLEQQPEVDPERIACMGNSGGGTATFYSACLEPRIKLAVVSCAFCTYADSTMRIKHCGDNYIPGILQVAEMGDLAGLIAPRTLIVVAGREDEIFPLPGVRKAYGRAAQVYEAAGCPENLRLVEGPEGHRFYAEPTWPLINEMV